MEVEKLIELIDRNALLEKAYFHGKLPNPGNLYPDGKEAVDVDDIEAAPTVDAVEVVHGKWVKLDWLKGLWGCSVCKKGVPYSATGYHYCPNCGARMDKKEY